VCRTCASSQKGEDRKMLRWAAIFLVVAIVAAVFGFGGLAGDAAWMAKVLLVVALVIAIVSFAMGRRVT
jgi:uncharacterized membrane protein YtjA (UPF0391 family)